MDYGKRLKELRESKELSQNKLAKMVGLAHSQISRFEKGRKISVNDLIKIVKALEISADDFLGLATEKKED